MSPQDSTHVRCLAGAAGVSPGKPPAVGAERSEAPTSRGILRRRSLSRLAAALPHCLHVLSFESNDAAPGRQVAPRPDRGLSVIRFGRMISPNPQLRSAAPGAYQGAGYPNHLRQLWRKEWLKPGARILSRPPHFAKATVDRCAAGPLAGTLMPVFKHRSLLSEACALGCPKMCQWPVSWRTAPPLGRALGRLFPWHVADFYIRGCCALSTARRRTGKRLVLPPCCGKVALPCKSSRSCFPAPERAGSSPGVRLAGRPPATRCCFTALHTRKVPRQNRLSNGVGG